jgi:hypothetical protein
VSDRDPRLPNGERFVSFEPLSSHDPAHRQALEGLQSQYADGPRSRLRKRLMVASGLVVLTAMIAPMIMAVIEAING